MKSSRKKSSSLFGMELGHAHAARPFRAALPLSLPRAAPSGLTSQDDPDLSQGPVLLSNLPRPIGGFTLIELLVVIAIIAILASLVLAAAGYVQKKGATARAQAEIAALGAALESYKADNGNYPTNSVASYASPAANTNLVTQLMPTNGGKVYFEFKAASLTNGSYLDPFGNVYGYNYTNGSANNGTNNYDLWSTAGGSTITNAWIKNW